MLTPELAYLRRSYELGGLSEEELDPDPIVMFRRWFADAAGLYEPNAMVLATVGAVPSARTVLLKGLDERGFWFFTNHRSRKAQALAADPRCALLFPWFELQRQVRVEGTASLLAREETEEYFGTRPRASQLGAWASTQSSVVGSRADLDASYAEVERRFADQEIPCPPHWGGYVVAPAMLEFWQGRTGRMHDRLVYRRTDPGWTTERLAP